MNVEKLNQAIKSGELEFNEYGHLIGKVPVDEAITQAYPVSFSIRNYSMSDAEYVNMIMEHTPTVEDAICKILTQSDFHENGIRLSLMMRDSKDCLDVFRQVHRDIINLSKTLGKYELKVSYTEEVWNVYARFNRYIFTFVFSNSSLGRTYPIEWPSDLPDDLPLQSPTDGFVTIVDYKA